MRCKQCNGEAVINQANWKQFYYCRTCKIEVVEASVKEDIEALYDIIVRKKQPYNLDTDKAISAITKKLFFGTDGNPMIVDPEEDKKLEEVIRTIGNQVDLSWPAWGDEMMNRTFYDPNVNLKDKWFVVGQFNNAFYIEYCKKLQNNNKGTNIINPMTVYFSLQNHTIIEGVKK